MKIEISINEITSVPKIILNGEEINNLIRINFNWETNSEEFDTVKSIEIEYATGVAEGKKPKAISISEKAL